MASDFELVKNHVLATAPRIHTAPEGCVRLEITHSVLGGMGAGTKTNIFKNFPLETTVFELKEIVHLHVGTSPDYMVLSLRDERGQPVGKLLEDSLKLGFFSPQNGWELHVEDRDPARTIAKYQDLSNLKDEDRFVYTEEQYDKRQGTLREYFRANPDAKNQMRIQMGLEPIRGDEDGKELIDQMAVGQRCQVRLQEAGIERGQVQYLGKLDGMRGYFVGVQLDLPLGKNDGNFKGKRYFECLDKCGVFVQPDKVDVGDYPEEDPLALSDDDN
eukprot:c22267_g1_i1.p2 GENE.c22267_g1_i1~~c22267_g1_i1.p2  ORF type:complete len:291 (+),score=79.24 c22267_g1_i1:56-874(+)